MGRLKPKNLQIRDFFQESTLAATGSENNIPLNNSWFVVS